MVELVDGPYQATRGVLVLANGAKRQSEELLAWDSAEDRVVAFSDGRSRGTANTIELARDAGKPVEVILTK